MANTKSAEKRARQASARRARNVAKRSEVRGVVKKVVVALDAGNAAQAGEAYKAAVPVIDAMVNKGIIHRNKADRHKSRLAQRLKKLATK